MIAASKNVRLVPVTDFVIPEDAAFAAASKNSLLVPVTDFVIPEDAAFAAASKNVRLVLRTFFLFSFKHQRRIHLCGGPDRDHTGCARHQYRYDQCDRDQPWHHDDRAVEHIH